MSVDQSRVTLLLRLWNARWWESYAWQRTSFYVAERSHSCLDAPCNYNERQYQDWNSRTTAQKHWLTSTSDLKETIQRALRCLLRLLYGLCSGGLSQNQAGEADWSLWRRIHSIRKAQRSVLLRVFWRRYSIMGSCWPDSYHSKLSRLCEDSQWMCSQVRLPRVSDSFCRSASLYSGWRHR